MSKFRTSQTGKNNSFAIRVGIYLALIACFYPGIITKFPKPAFQVFWLVALLALAFAFYFKWRKTEKGSLLLSEGRVTEESPRDYRIGAVIGVLGTVGIFASLELQQAYYFTQDDTHTQFLPIILHGCRSLFAGVFPTWNGLQYLGLPTASIGIYSLTYPFTYASYFLATYVLHDEYATVEVFALLHLVGAFGSGYWLSKKVGLRPIEALLGTLCFVFSGYQLVGGRSWYYMLPVATYFPILLISLIDLQKHKSFKISWSLLTAIAIGLWGHAGNIQMWIFGVMFIGVLALLWWATGRLNGKKVFALLPTYLLGVATMLPLLLVQFVEAKHRETDPTGAGIGTGFWNVLLPVPWVNSGYPNLEWDHLPWGTLYFSGGVFFWAFLIGVSLFLGLLMASDNPKRFLKDQAFTTLGMAAVSLAMSDEGVLWRFLRMLPPFDKFSMPFKFLAFVSLFTIFSGSFLLQRISASSRLFRYLSPAAGVLALFLTLWNCTHARIGFYTFLIPPYPALPSEFQTTLATAFGGKERIYPLTEERSLNAKSFIASLPVNYPTIYNLASFHGYDTTVGTGPENSYTRRQLASSNQNLLEYGVRWFLAMKEFPKALQDIKPIFRFQWDDVKVYELSNPKPMAFLRSEKISPHFDLKGNGIDVLINEAWAGKELVMNFLYRNWMRVYTDTGKPLIVRPDEFLRMVVRIPSGTQHIYFRYEPPWWRGFVLALIFAMPFGFCAWASRKRLRITKF